MRFRPVKRQNTAYNTQVANKEEALKLISEIDEYLDFIDDPSEYERVKKHVQTFEPVEYRTVTLTNEAERMLEAKFDELQALAESLK